MYIKYHDLKATIKFIKSYKANSEGYPICIELYHKSRRRREVIGRSHEFDWNPIDKTPLKTHPDYHDLLPVILEAKSKASRVNWGDYTFEQAEKILFQEKKAVSQDFYNAGIYIKPAGRNGQLYKTVLNNFRYFYPRIYTDEITPRIAKEYMNLLLRSNSPNGVHTYLRTLNTIYNKICPDKPNPFKGVRPKKVITKNKALGIEDLNKLLSTRTIPSKYDGHNDYNTINYPRFYWMLMFYLGGIDFVDLASLRYDKHVQNDRIVFRRQKGGTNTLINNRIFPLAKDILKKFDCYPYLVPIFKYKDYNSYLNRVNRRFRESTIDLKLIKPPLTKSARYSFITRAQQLLIDERITMEIVGHSQQKIHSIYTDEFPLEVRDKAHFRIIDCLLENSTFNSKVKISFNNKIFKSEYSEKLFFFCLKNSKFKHNRRNIGGIYYWFLNHLICKKYEFAQFWNSLDQGFKLKQYAENSFGLDSTNVIEVSDSFDFLLKQFPAEI